MAETAAERAKRSPARKASDRARETGAALEGHYRFVLWLVPTLEKFPRSQRFLLGDRIQRAALDVLESLIEATYTRQRRNLRSRQRTIGSPWLTSTSLASGSPHPVLIVPAQTTWLDLPESPSELPGRRAALPLQVSGANWARDRTAVPWRCHDSTDRVRITTVAIFSLMAGPAHAQRLFEMEGIELRGAARVVEYGAGTCNVSEERETPTEYERTKANHGQPVDVWQLNLSVYNGSGRSLDHLIARYRIAAENLPCTNWSWPEGGRPQAPHSASDGGHLSPDYSLARRSGRTTSMRLPRAFALALALVSLAGVSCSVSQTGVIRGRVVYLLPGGEPDSGGGGALQGAIVSVAGTTISALSDYPEGNYALAGVPAGEHSVHAGIVGYADEHRTVRVTAGDTLVLDFELLSVPLDLDGILFMSNPPQAYSPAYNIETYTGSERDGFQSADSSPASTFSLHVGGSSYVDIRRFILAGQRPATGWLSIEEMVNYFRYDRDVALKDHPLAVVTEVSDAPWKPEHRLVRIGLRAPPAGMGGVPPTNLVFLVDVSMSMWENLRPLKRAFGGLVGQLRPQDLVSIVVYAGAEGVVLPPTPGDRRDEILRAVTRMWTGGDTADAQGLVRAYRIARANFIEGGNNRVILATDGDFNLGTAGDTELIRLIEDEREAGILLSVMGFDSEAAEDTLMRRIARRGNGSFRNMGRSEPRRVFVEEIGGTLTTAATDLKLQVDFNPARVSGYRLIGYESWLHNRRQTDTIYAGHAETALYEVVPSGLPVPCGAPGEPCEQIRIPADRSPLGAPTYAFDDELMQVRVHYGEAGFSDREIPPQVVRVPEEEVSPSRDFRFAAAVAAFGMLLSDSPHGGGFTLDDVIGLAEEGSGSDPGGHRGEFIRLVRMARDLDLLSREPVSAVYR